MDGYLGTALLRSSFLQVKEKDDFPSLLPAAEGEVGLCGLEGGLVAAVGLDAAPVPHALCSSPPRYIAAWLQARAAHRLQASRAPALPHHPFCPSLSSSPVALLPLLSLCPSVCLSLSLQDPIPLVQARPSALFPEMATSPLLSSLQEQSQNSSLSAETGHHFISGLEWEIGAWDERIE